MKRTELFSMQRSPFSFPSLSDVIKGKAEKGKENSEGEFFTLGE